MIAIAQTDKLDAALQYAALGFRVFPCVPDAKRPLASCCPNGLLDATTDPEKIETWWTAYPDANVAIPTDGLLVVDLDVIEDGRANPWLADDTSKLLDLAAGALSITPRGGRHFIFRQPAGLGQRLRNTAGKLAPKVDTRADGGYILVVPSVVFGSPYRWGGQTLDCRPQDLPEPPAWLVDMLAGGTLAANSERNRRTSGANTIGEGQRNAALTSLAGSMRRRGMSEGAIREALLEENRTRCVPPMDEAEVRTIAWSAARYEPDQTATAVAEHQADAMFGIGTPGVSSSSDTRDPGPFPEDLKRVPGFIDQVIDYNVAGSYKSQPILALAGALALLSTLTGRKVADAIGTRTNLYIIGVAESGAGKERARKVNRNILTLAGLGNMVANEKIASEPGIIRVISEQPASLFQLDEFGRIMKTLSNPTKAPHLYGVITALLSLFTSADSVWKAACHADKDQDKTVNQPHAVLYGTTTPDNLYEGFTAESMRDGFVARTLIFESKDHPRKRDDDQIAIGPPPAEILEVAEYWGDLKAGEGNITDLHPIPLVVPYSEDATRIMKALDDLSYDEGTGKPTTIGATWNRCVEKAHKLAILFACSENHRQPIVGLEAATWAARLCEYLTRKIVAIGAEHVAENAVEARTKRVLRIIKDAGPDGISQSQLWRRTQWLTKREREEAAETLKLSGSIREETIATGGRPRTVTVAS